MRSFYRLLQYEFGLMLRGTLLLALGSIVTPLLFLNVMLEQDFAEVRSYEHLFEESGALLVLFIYFIALLVLFLKSVYADYWGGKSIYTMLTLPVRRERLYLAKLTSFMVAIAVIWGAAALSIHLGFGLLDYKVLRATNGLGVPENGMFLTVLRSEFLSFIMPIRMNELLSTISILVVITTGIYYAALCERSKRYWGFVVAAAALLLIIRVLVYRFSLPLSYPTDFNLNLSSLILIGFALWFAGHGLRLVKRGGIV
ncbi:hypothetical protein ACX1C1_11350 [Paenibacillus sp. strain BS8-2]